MSEKKKLDSTVCKFVCQSVEKFQGGNERVKLAAQYDQSLDEDRRFSQASPSGEMTVSISNPNVIGWFEPGKAYYLTATEA